MQTQYVSYFLPKSKSGVEKSFKLTWESKVESKVRKFSLKSWNFILLNKILLNWSNESIFASLFCFQKLTNVIQNYKYLSGTREVSDTLSNGVTNFYNIVVIYSSFRH